nr:MAG TPA: hypothetical protein [Caudoviricetes sp.]
MKILRLMLDGIFLVYRSTRYFNTLLKQLQFC